MATDYTEEMLKNAPGMSEQDKEALRFRVQFVQKLREQARKRGMTGVGNPGSRLEAILNKILVGGHSNVWSKGDTDAATTYDGADEKKLYELRDLVKPGMTDADKARILQVVKNYEENQQSRGSIGTQETGSLTDLLTSADTQDVIDNATSTGTDKDSGYAARLQEFKDALYNRSSAQRLGNMAAEQSARGSAASGWRGPVEQQGINQSVADAGFQYEQNVNAQALQAMGQENSLTLGQDQLAQQAAMFNAQQMSAASQQAFLGRQQMGGTIGGIAGGVVGGIIQGYTGAPVAGAFTAAGTGIGSMAAGGASPGPYTVGRAGTGSLGNQGRSNSNRNNGTGT